jgi:hypothetical protein
MGERFGLPSPSESAFVIQRDRRIVVSRYPETEADRSAFSCPPDHRVHEGIADTAPTPFWGDEHSAEQGPEIVRLVRIAGKTSRDSDPLPVPLGYESYAVSS